MDCQSCAHTNPSGARFCNACGAALGGPVERPEAPAHLAAKIREARASIEGERKQVTVLFADVFGSMDLAESTDPEAWRRIMDRFFAILCDGVHRFEGTVDKFTGDGIMALFGAPIAHEDHAQRACYAALEMQQTLAGYAAELRREQGLNFSVRIGINSGEVVVGEIGDSLGMEYTAIGHTVGLAQRMEQLAEPGKAYLSEHSAALVDGYMVLTDLGEFQVKGASRALRVHELTGVGAARGRIDISRSRGFSPFVGRDTELALLEEAGQEAIAGASVLIGIVGEPGVGKSRLCHEFAEGCRAKGIPVYHVSGQAHASSIPLLPVLQLLRSYFGISERDAEQVARERVAGKLLLLDDAFAEDLPLLFEFLTIPDPARPTQQMGPEARQRRLLAMIRRLVQVQSEREPGLNLFEDLHWVDPSTDAFLANHIEASQSTRSLTIVNFRPEYEAAWMSEPFYRQIELVPLGHEAIAAMLSDLLGSDPSVAGLAKMIRERTAGNPFFIEELIQTLIESGHLEGERGAMRLARPVERATVPPSVEAVLAARIDRLAEREKAVLQAAAVIGKEFAAPVLEKVIEAEPASLEDSLEILVDAQFIQQQELYPETVYAFRHPLTAEVAYGSQLAERRAGSHAAAARAIIEQYPERLEERAGLLAQHWESASDRLEAARWHSRAGNWAGTADPNEALVHWRRVVELTDSLPDTDETLGLSLAGRIFSLGYAWRMGISHDEAEAVFHEAEQIADRIGDLRARALLLSIYGTILAGTEGDARGYADYADRAIALAEESGDPALYVAMALGSYAFWLIGDYERALAIADRAIELADGDETMGAGLIVACPYALCVISRGGYQINLGRLEQAREAIDQGIEIAREAGDFEAVGWGHLWHSWLGRSSGDFESELAHSLQALEIAEQIGDSFSHSIALFCVGTAYCDHERFDEAIDSLERSLAMAEERRAARDWDPLRLMALGEAYCGRGDPERGLELLRQAYELARSTGNQNAEPYACLILARVLLATQATAAVDQARALLERAAELIEITKGRRYEPDLRLGYADLAAVLGDEEECERELAAAHRAYLEIGARPHADRLERELSVSG